MKRISLYFVLTVLLLMNIPSRINAQEPYVGMFNTEDVRISRKDNNLLINFNLDMTSVDLPSQIKVELVPVLKSEDGYRSHEFAPIIVAGPARDKAFRREVDLHNYTYPVEPQKYVVRKNGKKQMVPISMSLTYEEWMRDAKLVLEEEATGCANCEYRRESYLVTDRMLPPLFVPSYEVAYVMPEAEEVKQRSDTHSAFLNYRVGRYELLYDFENNARELEAVNKIVREVRNDENLTFQTLSVTGYASPEGNYNSNMTLSKNRAYSFVSYLETTHNLSPSMMKTDWKGEDWDGLRKVVAESPLPDRDAVLRIIDDNSDITRRKQQLHALNGGKTYQFLLKNYYPPLRRNEYTISYVARAFSVDEAMDVLKTNPKHLSLNEMFLVANTYPKESESFREVFDIAVRLFPDDPVANLNVAAKEIEEGNTTRAISRLQKIERAEAYNNLGVAYEKQGDYTKAAEYFKRAAHGGSAVGRANQEQLERFLKEQQ